MNWHFIFVLTISVANLCCYIIVDVINFSCRLRSKEFSVVVSAPSNVVGHRHLILGCQVTRSTGDFVEIRWTCWRTKHMQTVSYTKSNKKTASGTSKSCWRHKEAIKWVLKIHVPRLFFRSHSISFSFTYNSKHNFTRQRKNEKREDASGRIWQLSAFTDSSV